MSNDLIAELSALADRWDKDVTPAGFYDTAYAYADGQEMAYSNAADELRDVIDRYKDGTP